MIMLVPGIGGSIISVRKLNAKRQNEDLQETSGASGA